MSRTLKIVLPDRVSGRLIELADATGEPVSSLAARLLTQHLTSVTLPAGSRRERRTERVPARRPSWIEPTDEVAAWRAETWAGVLALHARYPDKLGGLQDGWWEKPTQRETIAALAVWRRELDLSAQDPREELLFHAHLDERSSALREQARGVSKAWQRGAPPNGWATG